MKKRIVTGLFTALAVMANAQSFTEWQNPELNAVNRARCTPIILLTNRKAWHRRELKSTLPVL